MSANCTARLEIGGVVYETTYSNSGQEISIEAILNHIFNNNSDAINTQFAETRGIFEPANYKDLGGVKGNWNIKLLNQYLDNIGHQYTPMKRKVRQLLTQLEALDINGSDSYKFLWVESPITINGVKANAVNVNPNGQDLVILDSKNLNNMYNTLFEYYIMKTPDQESRMNSLKSEIEDNLKAYDEKHKDDVEIDEDYANGKSLYESVKGNNQALLHLTLNSPAFRQFTGRFVGLNEAIDNIMSVSKYKKKAQTVDTGQILTPKVQLEMNYTYDKDEQNTMEEESTMEAIYAGKRTATTRYNTEKGRQQFRAVQSLQVGDLVRFRDKKGNAAIVEVTRAPRKLTLDEDPKEWSQLEGWSVAYYNKRVLPNIQKGVAYQFEYQLVRAEPKAKTLDLNTPILEFIKDNPFFSVKTAGLKIDEFNHLLVFGYKQKIDVGRISSVQSARDFFNWGSLNLVKPYLKTKGIEVNATTMKNYTNQLFYNLPLEGQKKPLSSKAFVQMWAELINTLQKGC